MDPNQPPPPSDPPPPDENPPAPAGGGWVVVQNVGEAPAPGVDPTPQIAAVQPAAAEPAAAATQNATDPANVKEWQDYYAKLAAWQQQQAAYTQQQQAYAVQQQQQQQQQQQAWGGYQQQAWGGQQMWGGQQQPQQMWGGQQQQQQQRMWGGNPVPPPAYTPPKQKNPVPPPAGSPSTVANPAWTNASNAMTAASSSFHSLKNRGLAPPPAVASPAAAAQSPAASGGNNAGTYPPTLEDYVKRCFLSCTTQHEREAMEQALKSKISGLDKMARCTRDWRAEPVPSLDAGAAQPAAKRSRWADAVGSPNMQTHYDYSNNNNYSNSNNNTPKLTKKQKKKAAAEAASYRAAASLTPQELKKKAQRAGRFKDDTIGLNRYATGKRPNEGEAIDLNNLEKYIVKGTMQEMEKKYFRLTSAPAPHTVRPEAVLRKALIRLKARWAEEPDYRYTADQLKAMRQDLTVQHIKNDLTVDVYETNARLALENLDEQNFNQCQVMLKDLYEGERLPGATDEFLGYRILYCAVYQKNSREMTTLLKDISAARRKHPAIVHAKKVYSAISSKNFYRFFRLHAEAPNMGAYLMDIYVEKLRKQALRVVCRAYKPTVPLSLLMAQLSFEGDDEQDAQEECNEFLKENRVVLVSKGDKMHIDTKASEVEFRKLDEENVVEKHF